MITYEEHRLRSLADEGRWIELLGAYRQARAAAVAFGPAVGGPADSRATGRRETDCGAADGDSVDGGPVGTGAERRAAGATAPVGHLIAYAA
ncbi:hypothetical protein, partial [Kitasatospora putterlickiae]